MSGIGTMTDCRVVDVAGMTFQFAIKVLFAGRKAVVVLAGLDAVDTFPQLCGRSHQHHFIGADRVVLTAVVEVRYRFAFLPLYELPTHVLVAIHVARSHPSDAPTIAGCTVLDHLWDVKRIERVFIIDDFQFPGCLDDVVGFLQLLRRVVQRPPLKPRNHPEQVCPCHVIA